MLSPHNPSGDSAAARCFLGKDKKKKPPTRQCFVWVVTGSAQGIQIGRQLKENLHGAVIRKNDEAGDAHPALGLDGVKFGARVAVFQKLLEGQHTAGNVLIDERDLCLGKSLFHRWAARSMGAGKHDELFHIDLSSYLKIYTAHSFIEKTDGSCFKYSRFFRICTVPAGAIHRGGGYPQRGQKMEQILTKTGCF